MYNKKQLINRVLYITCMTLAFTSRYADIIIDQIPRMFIAVPWIIFSVVILWLDNFSLKAEFEKNVIFLAIIYFIPHLVLHIYTIILMICGQVSWLYFTTNVSVYFPILIVFLAICSFKEKAIIYTIISIFISWLISIIISLISEGIQIIPYALIQGYINQEIVEYKGVSSNYFELHDIVLGILYIPLGILYTKKNISKKSLLILAISLFIFILGMKRTAVLAFIVATLFYILIKVVPEKKRKTVCFIFGITGIFLCYFYILLLSKGDLFYDLLSFFKINPMGRNYYYKEVMEYAEFSPSFVGIGRNVISKLMETDLAYLKVGGVHSDIIKMYVENGFIMFGLWLCYYLLFITRIYIKYFSLETGILYFAFTIYTFILYLTDNTEVYLICQILYMMIPMSYAIITKSMYIKWENHSLNYHNLKFPDKWKKHHI